MPPIKVAIVEDKPDLLHSLSVIINHCAEFELIWGCSTGESAISKATASRPDVVLMDIQLPRMDGVECTRRIKAISESIQILILTVEEANDDLIVRALQAGASGYLVKRVSMSKVLDSIKAVHEGAVPISANTARRLLMKFRESKPGDDLVLPPLTPCELDVLKLLAQGLTNKEIAQKLGVVTATVETHVRHVCEKLRVRNRVQAAVKYVSSLRGAGPAFP